MSIENKIVIGLAGEMSSGKTTVTEYIIKKYGGVSYRFSTPLSDIAERIYVEKTRINLQNISTMLRKEFGEDTLSRILYNDVKNNTDNKIILVDGVRRKEDIVYLETMPGFSLVYINASLEQRYKRLIGRNEKIDDQTKTFEEFKKEQLHESELEISKLKDESKLIFDNSGDLDYLYTQIDKFMSEKDET